MEKRKKKRKKTSKNYSSQRFEREEAEMEGYVGKEEIRANIEVSIEFLRGVLKMLDESPIL